MSDFASRFRAVRAHLRLTQDEMGALLGVSKQSVSGYESGASEPPMSRLLAPLAGRGIDAAWIYTGNGSMALTAGGQAAQAEPGRTDAPRFHVAPEAPPATDSVAGPVLFYVTDDDGHRIGAVRPFPEYVALREPPEVHFERMLGYRPAVTR